MNNPGIHTKEEEDVGSQEKQWEFMESMTSETLLEEI